MGPRAISLLLTLVPGLTGCAAELAGSEVGTPSETGGAPALGTPGRARFLARDTATLAVSLPPASREDLPLPEALPCGDFEADGVSGGVHAWRTRLPVQPGDFTRRDGPPGMAVHLGGAQLPYDRDASAAGTWHLSRRWLWVKTTSARPPQEGACTLLAPGAVAREHARQLGLSGVDPLELALTELDDEGTVRTGLLLPAPAEATWTLDLPEGAVLRLEARVLQPEVLRHAPSDGAEVVAEVRAPGDEAWTELGRQALAGRWEVLRLDLSEHAGPERELRLRTDPGRHTHLDYVYVAEPAVFVPAEDPRRVVLLFVDTLRPDRLGLYGYGRDTTPVLDAWAEGATVFTEARSVAPWTLPSVQAAFSGRLPEAWAEGPQLPELLAAAGLRVDGVAFNANLTPTFGFGHGWSHYHYTGPRTAAETVDEALALLEASPDQDLFLMAHFLDTHLPYEEPEALRRLWAGPHPEGLPERILRKDLLEIDATDPAQEHLRTYVSDRYDQALRHVDTEVARLLEAVAASDPSGDDIVILMSDHGEELWEHGGVEHGHALWEEVVRVPLVIRAPGLEAGRVDLPVSLLDLTPTVLDLLGLPQPGDGPGRSARTLTADRPQPLGWLLYEEDAWGVVEAPRKWTRQGGRQQLFDLDEDPGETRDLAGPETEARPHEDALARALGTELVDVIRVSFPRGRGGPDHELRVHLDGGFVDAWAGYDPRGARALELSVEDGVAVLRPEDRAFLPRTVYLQPASATPGTSPDGAAGLRVEVRRDGTQEVLEPRAGLPLGLLVRHRLDGVQHELAWDRVPRPAADAAAVVRGDATEALRALGYVE